jgi:acetyl esterase/lipase
MIKTTACSLLLAAFAATPVLADHHEKEPKIGPDVSPGDPMNIMPSDKTFDFAPDMDPQMQAVIEEFAASEPPMPITQLSPFQFRNATLPAEAARDLLEKAGIEGMPPKVDVSHRILPVGPDEGLLVRLYRPLDAEGDIPTVIYFHGGGWVIADLDTYDASARGLAARSGATVVSVAYRLAPEAPFPTAHSDAFAAYEHIVKNLSDFGGADKIALAGESAGGNLAVATALIARQNGVRMPDHIVSIYPVADDDTASASYDKYAQAMPLSRGLMEWFFSYYGPDVDGANDGPRELIDLIDADLSQLPPTTIINAQIDPLLSDGEELAAAIRAAGGEVERKVYDGVTHEFFGMAALLEQAADAQEYAADRLKESFASSNR